MPEGISRRTVLRAVDDERVAGVVAALEAHDAGDAVGQQIDDLALAFVAPLGADDDDVAVHRSSRSIERDSGARDQIQQTAAPAEPCSPRPQSRSCRSARVGERQHDALHRLRD